VHRAQSDHQAGYGECEMSDWGGYY
jgi:hypothetical protein